MQSKDQWIFEKADLDHEHGAYYRTDHNGDKCAVIFPADHDLAINEGGNALLHTRDHGSSEWIQSKVNNSLDEAKAQGDKHVRQYARDLSAYILEQAREKKFTLNFHSDQAPQRDNERER